MALQDFGHRCARFRAVGLACPFRKFDEDEDEPDEEEKAAERQLADEGFGFREIPFAFPARKPRDPEQQLGAISQFAVAPRELREALERMAAFQREGGLQSIPVMDLAARTNFRFSERGHPEIISVLAAIAIMQGLRLARSKFSGPKGQRVAASETRAARGLQQVLSPRGPSPGQGRPIGPGRGGFHVNAAANLRNLLGLRGGRKKRPLGPQQHPHSIGGGLPAI